MKNKNRKAQKARKIIDSSELYKKVKNDKSR